MFLSDRGGTPKLWGVRIRDGRPLGEPRLIHARLPDIVPKGFDKQGAYYYAAWQSRSNVYTAEVDFANNAVIGAPQVLESKHEGRNTAADWSPDGTRLAYLSRLGPQRLTPVVTIRDLKTGHDTELRPASPISSLHRYSNLSWSSDGKSLLLTAVDERELPAWYRIDVPSGRVTRPELPDVSLSPDSWSLSPDGQALFHRSGRQVRRIDLENKATKTIHQLAPKESDLRGLAVAPDERQLAVSSFHEAIRILSADGKEVRTVYQKGPDSPYQPASWCLTWTPDGKRLIFGMVNGDDGETVSLWQLPVDGGEPRALGITMPRLHSIRVHPDGRRLQFIARSPGPSGELWALDNVLAYLNSLE